MASSLRLPPPLLETLRYFDKYDYPLTKRELVCWAHTAPGLRPSPPNLGGDKGWYFLPGRQKIVALRRRREKISQKKWATAMAVGERLKAVPGILAVFVTGSLAMSNARASDDIDLMIITAPNTLWMDRLFVNLFFWSHRRKPQVQTAPDKICPNLWLDLGNLKLEIRNLYIAHEILQAKCIFDRGGVHRQFLTQNSWVKKYLPVAYKTEMAKVRSQRFNLKLESYAFLSFIFAFCNLPFYLGQLIYMKPKMTTEKVGLGFAFFHPKNG